MRSLVECIFFIYNKNAMKNLNFITPYTDEQLKWNDSTNRYELTLETVKANMDVNFANDTVTEKRIKKNSRKIYNFIKYRSYTGNAMYLDALLNKTAEGRKFLYDVLMEQLEADNETAFNDLSSQPAIDIATGREIARESLYANQISVDTEQIIERSADYFGFNIMVRTAYPIALQSYLRGGAK